MTEHSATPNLADSVEAIDKSSDPWAAYDETVAATGFWTMARRLPATFGRVLRQCWQVSPLDTAALVLCTLVAEIGTAIGLVATTSILDHLLQAGPTPDRVRAAAPALLLVAVMLVVRGALREAAVWTRSRLTPQLRRSIDTNLLRLTTNVELAAFDDDVFQNTLHRIRERAPITVSALLEGVLRLLSGSLGLIVVAGVLGVLHPMLVPLLLLALVPTWWAAVRAARMSYEVYAASSGAERRMETLSDLMAKRTPAAEIRAYTMRSFLLGEFDRLAALVQQRALRLERRQSQARALGDALAGVGIAVVYIALGALLFAAAMPLAVAGTAVVAIRTAMSALRELVDSMNWSYENALFFQDYLEFCGHAEQRQERRGGTPAPADVDRIVVRDVTFTYPNSDRPALNGLSIDIEPGEIIAIVGENGSGKTTLAKILSGLYRPDSGSVTYGGVPLTEIDLVSLRDRIAVIAQNFTHWPFSARQNVTIGRHNHPEERSGFDAAIGASGADEVFAGLPGGADTLLDPTYRGGVELSGGQWQRIAVARGLYRDAPLLICDEPTAALDARTEHAIFETIRRHAAQRTVVMITHRLATVRYADRIFVLDRGRVAERGSHAELMARDGIYREFYTLQAQAYQDEPTPAD
ncbi:ABC transporter ATP-binding protein/permease [Nocardia sp. CDC159]|uniref:ABC transporter ATP-binding protein/permease n=1 Tax=Nocardia pulmonis TaxID=2951408 RepID=A0A9X2EFN1_9NOCA|nr:MULTISPECIES: ABC transporter ATP-binding protein [Nocardia]MCM6777361.1 ABC transporter ATP-binding protein/permease [Nocardia pulmonis]MCM6790246.1 ABC transporter ATP-binding protein/permease [Nocardia sp. CDC159]